MGVLGKKYRKTTPTSAPTLTGGSSLGSQYRKDSPLYEPREETPKPQPKKPEPVEEGFFSKWTQPFKELGGAGAVKGIVEIGQAGINTIADKLSKTKFFQEAGAGIEQAIAEKDIKSPALLATAGLQGITEISKTISGRGAGQLIQNFIAAPINFTTKAMWGKETEIGKLYAGIATEMQSAFETETSKKVSETPFSAEKVKSPDFWATTVLESVPTTLAYMKAASSLYGATSKGVTSLMGSNKFAQLGGRVIGSLASGSVLRGFESAAEAEDTYKQAIQMGMTEERALEASKNAFIDNMKLVGLDAIQIALAFVPNKGLSGPLGKIITEVAKLAGAGITEGTEEVLQQRASKLALGEDFDINDPESKEAGFIGAVMGVLFQGAGAISKSQADKIQEEYADSVASNLPPELQEEYNKLTTPQGKVGFLERQANQNEAQVQSAILQTELENKKNVKNTKEAVSEIKQYVKPEELAQQEVEDIDPLISEARKYKSAEEFVKAQPKVYHGGTADIKAVDLGKTNFQKTFYVSDKADYAKSFGGNKSVVNEMVLDSKAKLADMRKPSEELVSQIDQMTQGRTTGKTQNIIRPDGTTLGIPEVVDRPDFGSFSQKQVIQGIRDGKAHFAELPEIKKALQKLGYDGQITAEVPNAKNIGVWNKEVIKTKSQLIDIYNKANKAKKPTEGGKTSKVATKVKLNSTERANKRATKVSSKAEFVRKMTIAEKRAVARYFGLNYTKASQNKLNRAYTDFYELASKRKLKIQPIEEKVSVSRERLPVGASEGFASTTEGKTKVSRLEARVRGQLENLTEEQIDELGLSTFETLNKKDNIRKADIYLNKNGFDKGIEILKGERLAPKGILPESIFVSMYNQSKGDVELATKLASLAATRAGQGLSILTELDPTSPVKFIKELTQRKIEALGGKEKVAERRKMEINKLKEEVKKTTPTKLEWESFVEQITC